MASAATPDKRQNVLQCTVITPEKTILETTARFVALPLFDGEIGIAPRHRPLIGRLAMAKCGSVTTTAACVGIMSMVALWKSPITA